MKTQLITTLAVAAIGIVLAGCRTVGDGVAEQKTFAGMQVEAIEITGPWTVEMNCGARENSVTVTVEQNLWKYVSIRTGRKFRLALDKDVSFTLPLKLTVNSTGNLSKADLKGSVNATVFNNKAQLFTLNLEDLCKFRGDNSAISIVNCDMEGNTVALFTGSISDLKLEAEENTIFRGGSITAATLNLNDKALVTLEEVGSAQVDMEDHSKLTIGRHDGALTGKAVDRAQITYSGKGLSQVRTSGSAAVARQ